MTALLLFGGTDRSAALRHEIPTAITDPLTFIELDGRKFVLTSELERARVAAVLPDAKLLDLFKFGYRDLVEHQAER
jgi:Xaa-Pro aminopeptidase